jgi:outer membrane receptor protein involved in Fe transport
LFSGNINLTPETSDTREYGIVFTPTFLEGFTATVDYFDITLQNQIGIIPQNEILQGCAGAPDGSGSNAFYCSLIHRSQSLGGAIFGTGVDAGFIDSANRNLGKEITKGVDIEANYTSHLEDWGMGANGSLSFNLLGTYTQNFKVQPVAASPTTTADHMYDCAGLFGLTCGTPIPKWRHKLRVTWTSPWDFDLSLDWRHMSEVKFDANTNDPTLGFGSGCPFGPGRPVCDLSDAKIGAYDYLDVSADYTVHEGISIHAGVQNVMDKNPPFLDSNGFGVSAPPFGNGNTYPQVYDALGRTIFLGVTVKY